MRYFQKIADGLDVGPALAELVDCRWDFVSATSSEDPRGATVLPGQSIYSPDISPSGLRRAYEAPKDPEQQFPGRPALRRLLNEAVSFLPGKSLLIAKVRILPPHSRMRPHRDGLRQGFERYQVALQCDEAASFFINQERCRFEPGQLWLVDLGDRLHHVVNESDRERIVLVLDMGRTLANSPAAEALAA